MTFLRWKKEKEKFSLKTFLSLKNFPNKKDNNLNLLSDFIVFVAYTKKKIFWKMIFFYPSGLRNGDLFHLSTFNIQLCFLCPV